MFRLRFPGARGLELFCPRPPISFLGSECDPSALHVTPGRPPTGRRGRPGGTRKAIPPWPSVIAVAPPRSAARKLRDKTRRVLARRFPAGPPQAKRRTRAKGGARANIQFAGKNMDIVEPPLSGAVSKERISQTHRCVRPTAAEPPAGQRGKDSHETLGASRRKANAQARIRAAQTAETPHRRPQNRQERTQRNTVNAPRKTAVPGVQTAVLRNELAAFPTGKPGAPNGPKCAIPIAETWAQTHA